MSRSGSGPILAILVGGRETRHLRIPKQNLPFGERTVLRRTLDSYLEAGFDEVVLVLGYKADQVQQALEPVPDRVRIVRNPVFDEGIASFVRLGVREAGAAAAGFAIGFQDQPILPPSLLTEMLEAFRKSEKSVLVPVCQGNLGIPILVDGSLGEEILSQPTGGDLWELVKRHGDDLEEFPTLYTAVVRSIDEIEDYHALLELAGLPIPELPIHDGEEGAAEEGAAEETADPAATEETAGAGATEEIESKNEA